MKITIRRRHIGEIPLLEVVPSDDKNSPLPLIVYYHGWQSSKELNLTQGRKLAQAGFRVLLPDAMNHGARKQNVSAIPSLTFWQSIQSNLFEFGAIISHFRKLNVILDDKIGVGGTSMGGLTSSALLTHHPEIKVASCMMGSPTPIQYRDRLIQHSKTMTTRFVPEDLVDLTAWVDRYDLSTHMDTLNGRPFFIWHGERDWRVPYDQTLQFVEAHKDMDNIHFVHEDEDHLVKTETMDMMTAFFVKYLL
ncbi:alpha/beta fold hydrolase [Aerococcus sp. 1KP-2016]|uniref:alpha/beta fold hydrolase n=1 Tax=Aerococcus sp. 1KP-2016 TaxID=1981982 RepID=UPI000B98ED56|nr:alpha/beta fold hydrolase [Aerococcus sp. 1KP-2016]OYQ67979.1 esterase [Aerococcus sp. 1KP-2016]